MKYLIALAALVFAGCATPVPPAPSPRHAQFIESEFAPYRGIGTAIVTGQTFLKTLGGDVKFGAGCDVLLMPVTSYTDEIATRIIRNGENLAAGDPRFVPFRRVTVADGTGNFEFRDLPKGEYYVTALITWMAPDGRGVLAQTGGRVLAKVTAEDGKTVKVILNKPLF